MKPFNRFHLVLIYLSIFASNAWAQVYTLGTTNLLEGPTAGSDSVLLVAGGSWTATTNVTWLHLSAANQSGTGSTNVIFTFDANPGATRTGTLTIAGQTASITQAGSTYVVVTNAATLASDLGTLGGVAPTGTGNVYIADSWNNAIDVWIAASNTVVPLVSSGLSSPTGVAVDGAGNLYIADAGNNAIKEWIAASNTVVTLVSSGLSSPTGVAVDAAGNLYIADTGNNAIKERNVANSNVTTLVSSGLSSPTGVAVDAAGNLYIADTGNNAIKEWNVANSNVTTLVSSGLSSPASVAVDGGGNVYIADTANNTGGNSAIKKWTAANKSVTTLVLWSGISSLTGVAVDGAGNVFIAGSWYFNPAVMELPHAFVDPTPKVEIASTGSDTLPTVLPATANLTGPFTPVTYTHSSWLTINGVTNGVVSFGFTPYASIDRTAYINLLGQNIPITQLEPANYVSLGTTNVLVGTTAGSSSVMLVASSSWTATTNAAWLHLSAANQSGTGNTNVIFTFDTNPWATRTDTLTIAGQTVNITQAGSTYVSITNMTTLVSSGVNETPGVAVDGLGNVYFTDGGNSRVMEWIAVSNMVNTLTVNAVIYYPAGIGLDSVGDVYFVDAYHNQVLELLTNGDTIGITTALSNPVYGMATDNSGNVYIADNGNNAIKEWVAASNTVITLVSSGLSSPYGVAVDAVGNVYIADSGNNAIKKWTAANRSVTTLVSSGLSWPWGLSVDGGGNVYISDTSNNAIKEWIATSNTVITLVSSGLSSPRDVAIDSGGNVYIADTLNHAIRELPHAFVDPTPKTDVAAAGTDSLPVVLPASANLTGPFAPVIYSAWLTVSGVTNGVVTFAFPTNNAANRTANILVLGQPVAITQLGPTNYASVGVTNLLVGPAAGTNSVPLVANGAWTATTNAIWLHLSAANQSGTGSTNVIFTFDANPGATRTNTLTIAGQPVSITQAGSPYVAISNLTTLVSTGLSSPYGLTMDGGGNIYIADTGNNAIKEWITASNTVITLVSSGLSSPRGVAVDAGGNVYIADSGNNAIKEWIAASNTVITLVSSGLSSPYGVAVDGAGNLYIADYNNNAVKERVATNNTVTTLVPSGLNHPTGVAVDAAGNVFIVDNFNYAIKKWNPANLGVTTSVSSGLLSPRGVAVDMAGNLYIANTSNNNIKKWAVATNGVATLISSGLSQPSGVAVDAGGNLYIADTGNSAIKELPRAFVDPTTRAEGVSAGSDSLPVVLPASANLTGPLAPTSDASWLTISSVNNGVVNVAFTANTSPGRTAHINLLKQNISVTQPAVIPPILTGSKITISGTFQFSFSNNQGASFTVWTTTNVSLPFTNWTSLGLAASNGFSQYQFADPMATNSPQRFYRVSSP